LEKQQHPQEILKIHIALDNSEQHAQKQHALKKERKNLRGNLRDNRRRQQRFIRLIDNPHRIEDILEHGDLDLLMHGNPTRHTPPPLR
jgi:UTP:GlnB (protein PII) uridylyltransferase